MNKSIALLVPLLVLMAATVSWSQTQTHTVSGDLVGGKDGFNLYFDKPNVQGSAVGEYIIDNTTGRNATVYYLYNGGMHNIIMGPNPDGTDQVRVLCHAPRDKVKITEVVFQKW